MSISPILEKILSGRGINNIDDFLDPRYGGISDPFIMNDMAAAVDRIVDALQQNSRIAVYSDYDADGIPGAVILTDFFKLVRHDNYCVYIPHRHTEGYGLHTAALDTLCRDGVQLVITCDLGMSAAAEVQYAQSIGLEIIVTDHHESDGDLPSCLLVHPKLGNYPDPMICGCAVAFQLIRAMIIRLRSVDNARVAHVPDGYEKWMLDLVGLSTIADMVPLVNENRILATYGLRVLRQTRRAGLRALAAVSRCDLELCDETMLGFRIVPYINAASRMEVPMLAYDLISETNSGVALQKAQYLSTLNTLRKSVVDQIIKTAHIQAQAQSSLDILWIGADDWHIGVLSIIAGRISEHYQKPVFVWAGHGDEYVKGSTRGVNGCNVLDIMLSAPDHMFKRRGGHAAAGGFTLVREYLADFSRYLEGVAITRVDQSVSVYDAVISISEITHDLIRDLDKLRPFGVGNQRPVWMVQARLLERKVFGKSSGHEKLLLSDERGSTMWLLLFSTERAIYDNWHMGEIRSISVYIEESGVGSRYHEIVLRPAVKH